MSRRAGFWFAQALLLLVVTVFVWRRVVLQWDELTAVDFRFALHPGWVALAAGTVFVTYALLIEAWRRLILGWGERLSYRDAVRIWTLSNLGRYLPGKIWSLAGLAVLAQRQGVAAWAAGGSALVMQGLALGTGLAIVMAVVPGVASGPRVIVATLVVLVTVAVPAWPRGMQAIGNRLGRPDVRALRPGAVIASSFAALLSWGSYGVAFWCLLQGVLPGATITPWMAIGAFAAGYIVGLVSAFAPGGIGVREGVLLSILGGPLGAGAAGIAAVAQRLLLTLTEGIAALVGLALGGIAPPHDRA